MSFKDIIGQHKAKEIISAQLKSGRIPHAYLFLGQDGIGRKRTALELARALNCPKNAGQKSLTEGCDHCVSCQKIAHGNHPDVRIIDFNYQANLEGKEIEKQKTLKIDTIRAMQKDIALKATEGTWKVFIVEPAEKITLDAANCLLKTLEEPPSQTVIILLAKHRENLPATIVSRVQIVFFSPLPDADIAAYLQRTASVPADRARTIAAAAEGSLANALALTSAEESPAAGIWQRMRERRLCDAELLEVSQEHAKTAPEFINDLLSHVKGDFRRDPVTLGQAVEEVIAAQKRLERNVNPQMILDVLLLSLNRIGRGRR